MAIQFNTLPDDAASFLQTLGNHMHRDMRTRGYTVMVEPFDLEYPGTPTLAGKRNHETHFIVVRQKVRDHEVESWVAYARSCTGDTRVTFVCGQAKGPSASRLATLKRLGIGVAIMSKGALSYLLTSRDLAMTAEAPKRASLKPKVRKLLGEPLDRFDSGDWRTAFGDAVTVLEEQCRKQLHKYRRLNRAKYKAGSSVVDPTEKQIDKMPLGKLKDVFCSLLAQNQLDATLCTALTRLNKDRIKKTHRPSSKRTEDALRKRVGTHFWLISNALAELA